MIEGLVFLASYSRFDQGAIGSALASWEQAGVFSYMLPFLLIFSLIFGILTQLNLFKEKNKVVNAIISLVVALMALQFEFVSVFFAEIFPRLGIGLVILLVVMVLIGLFAPNRTWVTYTLFAAAAIVLVVVLVNTAVAVEWFSSGFLAGMNWQNLLPWIILIVLIAVVVGSAVKKPEKQNVSSKIMQNLFGARE